MISLLSVSAAVLTASFGVPVAAPSAEPKPSSAAPVPSAVTMTVDNGVTAVEEGGDATYRITVRNNSDTDYPNALITQMLPQTLRFVSSNPEPGDVTEHKLESVHTSELQWIRHLPAHAEVTIDVVGNIGEPVEGRTGVTTTACVLPDGVTRPLICDSDADVHITGNRGFFLWIGAFVLVAAAAVFWFVRRRTGLLRVQV